MTTLGIDPAHAKPIAFAFRTNRMWTVVTLSPDAPADWYELFLSAKRMGVARIVIEDGFIGVNVKTGRALDQIRGGLAAVAKLAKLPVSMVAPATWQTAMLSQGDWTPKRTPEIEAQAKLRARLETGRDVSNVDEAAAVCIAAWGDGQR